MTVERSSLFARSSYHDDASGTRGLLGPDLNSHRDRVRLRTRGAPLSRRSAWARRADKVAEWLGVAGKGTTRSGRSRIPFPYAIIDSRTTLRSSSFRAAEETRSDAKFNGRPWVHLHFSRRNPGLVSIIVDEKLAAVILKFLAWRKSLALKILLGRLNPEVMNKCIAHTDEFIEPIHEFL